jgi:translation initiation factor 3 subunit L
MYAFLAICTSLSPGPTDEGIMTIVKEHYGDQLSAMQNGASKETALAAFKELFVGACPKFLSPVSPPYEDHDQLAAWVSEPPQDALLRQTDLFISDVDAILGVSTMRSFLKLYTSIDATKLANFLDEDEDTVLERMMSLKAASRSYAHRNGEGSLLDGERIVTNNLDFYIQGVSFHARGFTSM